MIWVEPAAMLASLEASDTGVEVVEGHGEVPRVPPGRFEPDKPRRPQDADLDEGEHLEALEPDDIGVNTGLLHDERVTGGEGP
jgi:hypothetical protein